MQRGAGMRAVPEERGWADVLMKNLQGIIRGSCFSPPGKVPLGLLPRPLQEYWKMPHRSEGNLALGG